MIETDWDKLKMSEDYYDKQFVYYVHKMFPDVPNGFMCIRFSMDTEYNEELDKAADKLFSSEMYVVAPLFGLDTRRKVVSKEELYDAVSDGKNPCDIYAAHYAHSDGWNETIIMSANHPRGCYAIGIFNYEKILKLIEDSAPEMLFDIAEDLRSYGTVLGFNDNTGMEDYDL